MKSPRSFQGLVPLFDGLAAFPGIWGRFIGRPLEDPLGERLEEKIWETR